MAQRNGSSVTRSSRRPIPRGDGGHRRRPWSPARPCPCARAGRRACRSEAARSPVLRTLWRAPAGTITAKSSITGFSRAVDIDGALPFLEAEELVAVLMDLLADLLARLQRHQHQLQMLAGVEDVPEVLIVDRQLVDIVAKAALHVGRPLRSSGFVRIRTVSSLCCSAALAFQRIVAPIHERIAPARGGDVGGLLRAMPAHVADDLAHVGDSRRR